MGGDSASALGARAVGPAHGHEPAGPTSFRGRARRCGCVRERAPACVPAPLLPVLLPRPLPLPPLPPPPLLPGVSKALPRLRSASAGCPPASRSRAAEPADGRAGGRADSLADHGRPAPALSLYLRGIAVPCARAGQERHLRRHQKVLPEAGLEVPPRQEPRQPRGRRQVQGDQQRARHPHGRHQAEHLRQVRLAGALRGRAVRGGEREHLLRAVQLVGQGAVRRLRAAHLLLLLLLPVLLLQLLLREVQAQGARGRGDRVLRVPRGPGGTAAVGRAGRALTRCRDVCVAAGPVGDVDSERPQTHRLSYSRRLPQRPPSSRPTPTPATTPTGSIKCREAVIGGSVSTGPLDPRIMNWRRGGGEGAALAAGKGPLPPLCPPARPPPTREVRSMRYLKQCSYGRCPPSPPPPVACVGFCSVSVCVVDARRGGCRARSAPPPGAVAQAAVVRWPRSVLSLALRARPGRVLLPGCGVWSVGAATGGASGPAGRRGAERALRALSCPVVPAARTVWTGPVRLVGLARQWGFSRVCVCRVDCRAPRPGDHLPCPCLA